MAEQEQPEAGPSGAPDNWLVQDLLQITATEAGTCVVLSLRGELDVNTAPLLRQQLLDSIGRGRGIILDTTELQFCGSSGLAVLVEANNQAPTHAATFRIVVPPHGALQRTLQITGLSDTLPTAPDLNTALL